jgi:hypothetical protein
MMDGTYYVMECFILKRVFFFMSVSDLELGARKSRETKNR